MITLPFITIFLAYLSYAVGTVYPGKLKDAVYLLLLTGSSAIAAALSVRFPHAAYWGYLANGILIFFFTLFYNEENPVPLPYVILTWASGFAFLWDEKAAALFPALAALVLSVYRRELKQPAAYLKLLLLILTGSLSPFLPRAGVCPLVLLLWATLELTRHSYRAGYERSTRAFQQNVLLHQYEETKEMYLNMRGWRHDYHNHIQGVKAYLSLGQIGEAAAYLDELDADLTHVDSYIRSGNLMADAILNSKLSLAEKAQIRVDCTAKLPEKLALSDVDLCVILGNLLDNAIEACEQIEPEKRFLRVYMVLIKEQLYISVQNAAKEILNFNERNYITSKRGQHGLGLMRMKLLVDKYEGCLNLQNEPGIFAAEVTLPCGE